VDGQHLTMLAPSLLRACTKYQTTYNKKERRNNKRTKEQTISPAATFIFILILAYGEMPCLDAKLQHRIFSPFTRSLISLVSRSPIPSLKYDFDARQLSR